MSKGLLGVVVVVLVAGMLAGCEGRNPLVQRQEVDRANMGLVPLANAGEEAVAGPQRGSGGLEIPPPVVEEKGMFSFTVPTTVTRVKRTTEGFEQYAVYEGRPAEGDVPFVVVTVAPKVGLEHERAGSVLKAGEGRRLVLNGLMAEEWTGYTTDRNYPFVELRVKRPGGGDELAAVAVARNEAQRKLAMEVLGSIRWEAK